MIRTSLIAASMLAVSSYSLAANGVASQVVSYTPGSISASLQNSNSALGLPNGNTTPAGEAAFDSGALTPFNPPFLGSQIMGIGAGGSLTLKLDNPVTVNASAKLGVYSNVGLIDIDGNGAGVAMTPAAAFSTPGVSSISVSTDGNLFTPVGAGNVSFANPTNYYVDTDISFYYAPLGTQAANFFKPFGGSLSSFDGLKYRDASAANDILRVLGGSAGGTWVDLSGVSLSSVQYVRFDVPTGERMIIDSVVAIPEPGALGLIGLAALMLKRRR